MSKFLPGVKGLIVVVVLSEVVPTHHDGGRYSPAMGRRQYHVGGDEGGAAVMLIGVLEGDGVGVPIGGRGFAVDDSGLSGVVVLVEDVLV